MKFTHSIMYHGWWMDRLRPAVNFWKAFKIEWVNRIPTCMSFIGVMSIRSTVYIINKPVIGFGAAPSLFCVLKKPVSSSLKKCFLMLKACIKCKRCMKWLRQLKYDILSQNSSHFPHVQCSWYGKGILLSAVLFT